MSFVSSGELKAREAKLKKEQQDRARAQGIRAERERLAAQRVASRQASEDDAKRAARIAEQRQQEELRQRQEADREHNRGVVCKLRLRAVPIPEGQPFRGIRRAADKVLLPQSVGQQLEQQGAAVNGAPFFQLRAPSGAATHAGALVYEAAEGTVALPLKVIRSLWGPDATEQSCVGDVAVKYVRLEKGKYVKFQPRHAAFQKAAGDDVSGVLEAALAAHSCLSTGDWLRVAAGEGGSLHDLQVLELRPGTAVSVIDTEMDAEVEPSLETEERAAAEAAAARRRLDQLAAIKVEQQRAAAVQQQQRQEAEAAAARQAAESDAVREAKRAALPQEPGASAGEVVVTCVLRFPDGKRAQRRFRVSDALQALFDFTDAMAATGPPPGSYQLIAQMPRRILHPASCAQQLTLQQAGLQHGSETLMLEPLPTS